MIGVEAGGASIPTDLEAGTACGLIRRFYFSMPELFDLFGDPVPANFGGRGRPAHVPTNENRNKVSLLLACGWSNERIAKALGITLPTLRKHYLSLLKVRDEMRDRLDARLGTKLMEGVNGANVAAIREMRKFLEHNDRMLGNAAHFGTPKERKPKEPKLGKKEAEKLAAGKVADEWADLVPSRTPN